MKVSELMHTPAVTARPSATVGEVAATMGSRNVGAVVIVDERGAVRGVVTDRDLALRVLAQGRSADIPVEHVTTIDVATVPPSADATDAAAVMTKRGVRRLVVADEDGFPHGVVALDDLLRQLGREADALTDTLIVQAAHLT